MVLKQQRDLAVRPSKEPFRGSECLEISQENFVILMDSLEDFHIDLDSDIPFPSGPSQACGIDEQAKGCSGYPILLPTEIYQQAHKNIIQPE